MKSLSSTPISIFTDLSAVLDFIFNSIDLLDSRLIAGSMRMQSPWDFLCSVYRRQGCFGSFLAMSPLERTSNVPGWLRLCENWWVLIVVLVMVHIYLISSRRRSNCDWIVVILGWILCLIFSVLARILLIFLLILMTSSGRMVE